MDGSTSVDTRCKGGPFGFHPEGYFDEHSPYDIEEGLAEVANTQSRQEIRTFWVLRHECPICRAAITQDMDIFARLSAALYDRIARKCEVFRAPHHNEVLNWATLAYQMHEAGVSLDELPSLSGNTALEEVSELIKLMLTPMEADNGHTE